MILALEAASPITRMWLLESAPATAPEPTLEWESGRTLADQLLTRITALLADHQLTLQDLTGIVLFAGPGSFTSLRIGHMVANTLADSLHIPIVNATGEDWLVSGCQALTTAQIGQGVMPHYGSEAHITKSINKA